MAILEIGIEEFFTVPHVFQMESPGIQAILGILGNRNLAVVPAKL